MKNNLDADEWFMAIGLIGIIVVLLLTGCGKITVELTQDEPIKTDTVQSDPIYVIVTGNPTTTIGIPTGNYIVSGNELIVI